MSRTLFWYVFRDLLRIFLLTSGALAGIMSFGGLLRPLTQNGLDGSQVLLLLRYSMPAMSTYSLPVAALFATTVVYGRMAADNEQTACRASGISFLSMSMPAMLLGLLVSLSSMFLLCFTVPAATLRIEQVVVSNLAQVIAHQIEATHEIHFNDGQINIFAESAYLPKSDPRRPNDSEVELTAPMICSYMVPPGAPDRWFQVPREFYNARTAIAYIHENPEDASATLRAVLFDGSVFPRRFTGPKSQQGGLATAEFGPQPIPSRLEQKAKFMNILQLKNLEKDPFQGQEVQRVTAEFIKEDQAMAFTQRLLEELNASVAGGGGACVLRSDNETYTLQRLAGRAFTATNQRNQIVLASSPSEPAETFIISSGAVTPLRVQSRQVRLTVDADTASDTMQLNFDFTDALVDSGEPGDIPSAQARFTRHVAVPMPPDIAAFKSRTAKQYLDSNVRTAPARQRLLFAVVDLVNHLQAEMHARAAFVVSCLLLVMVGTALGMMFRSGNFLNAFAVSVVPAMFSTVLIVSGQHVAQATPINDIIKANPLHTGLTMIWASNVLIGIAAVVLLARLQRQ